jgi:phosphatidylserine decarboxylase
MKNSTTTQLIAKEGWKYLTFTFLLFALALFLNFLVWVFFLIFIFAAYLFRNPERLPAEDDIFAILAPADGTISSISKVLMGKKEYIKVEIQKHLLDSSLLRAPTSMHIISSKKRHGLFLPIGSSLNKTLGESVFLTCRSRNSDLLLKINAGIFSRNIELFKTIGPLRYSQRFGLLVEGSVELFVEVDSRIKVALGDKIKAGESVLGYFAHKENKIDK